MTKPRLHLDADASRISLVRELLKRGHDVTRTPNPWMRLDATDEQQILGATAQGRIIFTFNIRDFIFLSKRFTLHGGILLSIQRPMPVLLNGLDRVLRETRSEDWLGQTRWINDWLD